MTATIVETNSTPFNRVDVDTVTVDIIENALRNVRVEMDAVLFRTAMSPGIREQGDCFPMVANKDGKMVVGQFGSFIHGFMDAYDEEIEEGDIILTNDPYLCNAAVSHLPDWIVLVPIFKDGRHMAWSAMFGHMSDNGGMVPGSIPIKAETIYQEGIRIPPTKLYKKGELQSDILELILHNVRTTEWNRFDLNALVAACRTAGKRCVGNCRAFRRRHFLHDHGNHARAQPHGDRADHQNGRARKSLPISKTTCVTTASAKGPTKSRAKCGAKAARQFSILPAPIRRRRARSTST